MVQTIAEALREAGHKEGRLAGTVEAPQQTFLRQLRGRFGKVPKAAERRIRATHEVPQLNAWLDRVVTAERLEDLGLAPKE